MLIQEWFNDNQPSDDMLYNSAMVAQFIWVRDTLTPVIFSALSEKYPTLKEYDNWKEHSVVYNTHTSKSIKLPIYTFAIGTVQIDIRCNFHDWCVGINGFGNSLADIPEYMNPAFGRGYYEGMGDETKYDTHFCVRSKEQLYAVLWWMLNELPSSHQPDRDAK